MLGLAISASSILSMLSSSPCLKYGSHLLPCPSPLLPKSPIFMNRKKNSATTSSSSSSINDFKSSSIVNALMGSVSKRESHVLKLVHPGGFVELHTQPIMASQVMTKNPRHFVTRPDIFRFPWIVVSPESILTPGNVFFIVPCHTIRSLLKNPTLNPKQHHRHARADDNYNNNQGCYRARKVSKSKKVQCFSFSDQSSVSQTSMSCVNLRTTTPREAQAQKQKKKASISNKSQSSFVKEMPVCYSSEHSSSHRSTDAAKERAIPNSRGLCPCDQKKVPKLKPCLKKKDNMMMTHNARSRNLKVRFACTHEDLISNNTYIHYTAQLGTHNQSCESSSSTLQHI